MGNQSQENRPSPPVRKGHTLSLGLVVTLAVSFLVLTVTVVTGTLFIQQERSTLEDELRLRLLAQGRNVASLASKPMLDDFPEFTLHPLVKKLRSENSDWSYLVIVNADGLIKGSETMSAVDTHYEEGADLQPSPNSTPLAQGETLMENASVYQLEVPIRFQDGSMLGRVYLGLSKAHVASVVTSAVKTTVGVTGVVLLVGLFLSTLLASSVVRPVRALTAGAKQIGSGNLAHRIDSKNRTELGVLARTFDDMAGKLEIAQREMVEKERIRRELEIAHELEEKLLPASDVAIPGWEMASFHRSAEEVGGDYYDVVPLGAERYGIAIGDVAGKGIPGLVVMAMAGALLRSNAAAFDSPSALLARLNQLIHPSVKRGMFITLFYGILDARRGSFCFSNAGHNPLLFFSETNDVCHPVKTTGMPIGLIKGARFEKKLVDQTIGLENGDLLVQYTDGVSEAVNPSEEEFGIERIVSALGSVGGQAATRVVQRLSTAVDAFAADAKQSDDITIVALRRTSAARENDVAGAVADVVADQEALGTSFEGA